MISNKWKIITNKFYVGVTYSKGLSSIDLDTLGKIKETVDVSYQPRTSNSTIF